MRSLSNRPATLGILFLLGIASLPHMADQQAFSQEVPAETQEVKIDETKVKEMVRLLASNKFAQRELAMEYLASQGADVVPYLNEAIKDTSDAEVKLRATSLLQRMNFGDEESRIKSFLEGENIEFEGWGIIRIIFGDNATARELFIDMHRKHPDMMESLDGSARELTVAMEKVAARSAERRSKLNATVGDAIAMLLPATDPQVPVGANYEKSMLFMIRRAPVNRVRRDQVLGLPFKRLLTAWIIRSSLENREDVINFSLEWEIPNVYMLAIRTLDESKDPVVLCTAMQAIVKYGSSGDSQLLLPFLDNDQIADDSQVNFESRVCDVAAASIAVLNKVPLAELGFEESAMHERYGIAFDEIGFSPIAKASRQAAIKQAKAINQKRVDRLNEIRGFQIPNLENNEAGGNPFNSR